MAGDLVLALANWVGHPAKVFQRIAQVRGLPIKLGSDAVALDQRIARLEVAMHQHDGFGLWGSALKPGQDVIEFGVRLELRLAVLSLPVRQLMQRGLAVR